MSELERELIAKGWHKHIDSRDEVIYMQGSQRKVYNKHRSDIIADYDITTANYGKDRMSIINL